MKNTFNHNGAKVIAQNQPNYPVGTRVNLSYVVDGRGNGQYRIAGLAGSPVIPEIRYNNQITTPDTTGTILSIINADTVWVERDERLTLAEHQGRIGSIRTPKKAISSAANGAAPPRPGSNPRGRPKKQP